MQVLWDASFSCMRCLCTWWLLLPTILTPDTENVFEEASTETGPSDALPAATL
jgi:hypothetical protein